MATEVVKGQFKAGKGDWDGMHTFATRKGGFGAKLHAWTQFGGQGGGGSVTAALKDFYKKYNLNPCITAVKLTVDPKNFTVDYEFTIEESPDGNAYVVMSSWGGASGGYPKQSPPSGHAYRNYQTEYAGAKKYHKNTVIKDILDFYFPGGFRQIFFQFTWPDKFPNLPKSPGLKEGTVGVKIGPSGSPKDLPLYNGVTVFTTSLGQTGTSGTSNDGGGTGTTGSSGSSGTSGTSGTPGSANSNTTPPPVKITLKKKLGPGQIMGTLEKQVYDNESFFKDLQFDTPGEYVISVVPSSPDVEPTEWQVSVKPDPNAPQEPRGKEEEKIDGSRPIITQIDKPTVLLPPIEFDTSPDAQNNRETAASIGYQPFFWYAGYQITPENITSLNLYHEGIVPHVSIIFYDTIGFLKKEGMPTDNSKIEVFLNSGSDNLKSIHLRFKIVKFQENKGGTYTILGILDLNNFYKQNYQSYTGTSFEVLRTIAKENELGFNSNIESSDDSMKWSNTGKTPAQFMTEIMKHSYISDTSFVGGYIDYYYSFNLVDIEKEWIRDTSADLGIDSQGVGSKALDEPAGGEQTLIKPMSLSNDKSQQSSSFYISKFEVNNDSTSKSLRKGQFTVTKYYDSSSKSFLIFNVDSLTSEDGKNLILKGSKTDKTDLETNFKTTFSGRIDTENVHKNYAYAEIQNRTNFDNLTRITVDLELPNANFNIYKFMKIKINFVNQTPTVTLPELNYERISGEWIVVNIEYVWSNNRMSQKLLAVRKELGKTKEELENTKEEPKGEEKGETEKNENPVDGFPDGVPNRNYKVGEFYSAVDKSGRDFSIEITEVSANGIQVTANVLEIPKPPPPPPKPPDPPLTPAADTGTDGESSTGNSSSGSDASEAPVKLKRQEDPPAGVIKAMKAYGITNNLVQAHFIAQIAHESGQFQWSEELASGSAYEGRTDLGNTKKGDGKRYKGRGYMQLTGRANYEKYAEYLKGRGVKDWDVVSNPEWVAEKYPADVSCYFWCVSGPKGVKKFSKKALEGSDDKTVNKIGTWINGGNPPNGAADRRTRFKKYWEILKANPKKYL